MRPSDELPLLGELLVQITAQLAAASFDLPRQEAQWLLCDALQITPSQLHARKEQSLAFFQVKRVESYLARRLRGEPLAHIHGEISFAGLTLTTDQRALIPRPETEQMAALAASLKRNSPPKTILDLGTGTGCLALALKKNFPAARVVGSDLSRAALALARANGKRSLLKVQWKCGSWWVPHEGQSFDLIVANPPYIGEKIWQVLDPQVRDFEPKAALVSGPTGFEALELIAAQLREHLNPGGSFLAEIGFDQAPSALALFAKWSFAARVLPDLWGKQRFLAIE